MEKVTGDILNVEGVPLLVTLICLKVNGKVDVVCTSLFYRGEERISIKIQTKFQKDTPYLDHGSCSIINLKRIGDPFDFRLVEGGVTF